jgi:hypothetical protein
MLAEISWQHAPCQQLIRPHGCLKMFVRRRFRSEIMKLFVKKVEVPVEVLLTSPSYSLAITCDVDEPDKSKLSRIKYMEDDIASPDESIGGVENVLRLLKR